MLKKRIIPIQLLKNGRLVKGTQFADYRDVGNPVSSSGVYNSQQADELIFLNTDIDQGIEPLIELIEEVSNVVFMPLSFGGGIRTFEDAAKLISLGADKVILNSVVYQKPELITEIIQHFGSQAVIVNIDVRSTENGWQLFSGNGQQSESVSLEQHINSVIEAGAGEIMLQSIDKDGSMSGFDIELAQFAAKVTTAPLILAGGSGNYEQLKDAFEQADISACACGSLFNFSDSNPMRAMAFLRNYDLPFKKV